MFTLELPLGRAPRTLRRRAGERARRLGVTLDRRAIVVVEDEPAVREGLEVLLKGWGASVDVFDSVAARPARPTRRRPRPRR